MTRVFVPSIDQPRSLSFPVLPKKPKLMEGTATVLNLASIISHHARLAPQKEAIVWNNVRITYGELDKLSNRVANALVEMGIGHGDKVALNCINIPYFPIVYYGIMKAGCCGSSACAFCSRRPRSSINFAIRMPRRYSSSKARRNFRWAARPKKLLTRSSHANI